MTLSFAPERIERWPLERLRPYARNAKTHGDDQVAKIAASMAQFGWTVPVLVGGDGEVIAGHGRILAASHLGLTDAPVIVLDHLTEAQRRAYRIADNKLTELGAWDESMLAGELQELLAEDFDLSLVGFSDAELDALLAGGGDADGGSEGEDEVPEAPADPVSRPGDLWLLGPHRLICGDSTVATDVERVLNGVTPLLMVSDPPYGVEYDPSWRNRAGAASTRRTGKVLNDDRADWREAWALFPGDVAYVWHGALHATTVAESLLAAGFAIRSQIIWAKERLVLSRGDYHWQHEPCLYSVRKTGKAHWAGDRKQTTLWQISSRDQDAETVHGTQKPVECMRRPILNNSSPGQAVYEPFMGSGTTLIAAETTGRVCLGVELNPAYVDVAVERWQRFTGKAAFLDGSGATFGDLGKARLPVATGSAAVLTSAAGGHSVAPKRQAGSEGDGVAHKGCRRAATGV
jgi:DNA modification methylase